MLAANSSWTARRPFSNDPTFLTPVNIPINYEADANQFKGFVEGFGGPKEGYEPAALTSDDLEKPITRIPLSKYMTLLQEVANLQRTTITLELDDMMTFDEGLADLVERIEGNTHHYLQVFYQVLDALMPSPSILTDMATMDVVDVLASHRRARSANVAAQSADIPEATCTGPVDAVPSSLLRRYTLFIKPTEKCPQQAVRQLSADQVGGLVKVKGIITRISEVRPLLTVATYTCERCSYEVFQEVTTQAFMPLPECPSDECRRMQTKGKLVLQSRGSRFQKFQEARIQELTDQVPMGHIPRSMAVVFMGDLTRQVNPGDGIVVSAVYMPKPYSGFKAIRAGLLTDTYLLAQDVVHLKPKYDSLQQVQDSVIDELAADPQIYERLARSIAPEIYGHVDVKKALVLLMVGGATRNMDDGMKIRGDINICLMGDPGVAKSQLLKYITKIAPRAVYTTGKGSSGVGLTASVTRDPITNEMVLEGGALVLADNGICCIDEFDKMEESDRTAIHEVMEQQTISISKAGITTTLNARTSILAAANPLHGRYNPKRSPRENINLPPALLSRFDLLFLILDKADLEDDTRLAEHVCQVHRTNAAPAPANHEQVIDAATFRKYIARAKTFEPMVPPALVDYIVGAYVGLRMNDGSHRDSTYTTPRTLLAILRLSQALARLRFSTSVNQQDIEEAMRLMDVSRSSVDLHLERADRTRLDSDPITKILTLIRDLAAKSDAAEVGEDGVPTLPMDLIRDQVRGRGFSDEQLQNCLVAFDQCNIWSVSADGTTLKIFN